MGKHNYIRYNDNVTLLWKHLMYHITVFCHIETENVDVMTYKQC